MKTLLFAVLLTISSGAHADCAKYIQAFNLWDDEINGQIVEKVSVFSIDDWDPNAQFEGIVLTAEAGKSVKKATLEVEFKANRKNGKRKLETFRRLKTMELDKSLAKFDDFDAKTFFNLREAGTYTVRLKDDASLICSQTFKYNLGH